MSDSQSIKPDSTITCPHCGHSQTDTMPTDSCQFFWKCPSCETVLKPKEGDCCVYCSYGETPCPPIQGGDGCGDSCRIEINRSSE